MSSPRSVSSDATSAAAAAAIRTTLSGLFAALTTPLTTTGALDLATFDRHLDLVLEAGADGICLGGATSEYPHLELADRKVLITRAARRLPADKTLLVAIGGPTQRHALDLGRAAFDDGCTAVLVPMPMFFRYQQDDLQAMAHEIADRLAAPCLLYDLPVFTNPLAAATVIDLLTHERHIVGIKDSSGRVDHLTQYAEARGARHWTLMVGDDARLREAVLGARWDGSISGLASVCPELLVAIVRAARAGDVAETVRCQALVDELIGYVGSLPFPWGIRIAIEARGLPTGPLPWPMAPGRQEAAARLRAWLPGWLRRVGAPDWTPSPHA